jgi:starvation-inducible DNA-binding protein
MKDPKTAPARADLFPTRSDLSADVRRYVVEMLNQQLANLTDLWTQTKHAHWNVKGPTFWALHKLFDRLAEEVQGHIDEVAERTTALGGVARGTARTAATSSRIDEFPAGVFGGPEVTAALADRYAAAGRAARQGIAQADEHGDADTADLLTQVSRDLDHALYFLEAHLQPDARG